MGAHLLGMGMISEFPNAWSYQFPDGNVSLKLWKNDGK
jgi:hypothetical protein